MLMLATNSGDYAGFEEQEGDGQINVLGNAAAIMTTNGVIAMFIR